MDIIEQEKKLVSYSGEDKVISSGDMQTLIDATIKPVSFKSDMDTLDKTIGGFEGGEVVTISGLTGNGKTLLAQTLTRNFSRQAEKCVWFSYEVMPRNFLKVFGNELPLFYLPSVLKDKSLKWIEQRVWEAKLKYDARIVFIDHLHFLLELRSRANMSLEIGFIMRGLKTIAKKYNLVIFLLAHTQKIDSDKELDVDSIRDSSFVGQESDTVLMIWRKTKTTSENEAVLKVCKNRKEGTIKKIDIYKAMDGFLREGTSAELSQTNTRRRRPDEAWD